MRLALALAVIVVASAACHKSSALAELVDAKGPVMREQGDKPWAAAEIGATFSLGDAARTSEGTARLQVTNGPVLDMLPHTTLRFGAQGGGSGGDRISVEAGAVELSMPGGGDASSYGLDVGDVSLSGGAKLRITAGSGGASDLVLEAGAGTITRRDGSVVTLTAGATLELSAGASVVTPVKPETGSGSGSGSGSGDGSGSGSGSGSASASSEVAITATGRVDVQAPGETAWKPLAKGATTVPLGAHVRVAGGGSAKLVAKDTTLQLAGGSRAAIGTDLVLTVEAGTAEASVPVAASGEVHVPGGGVGVAGDAKAAGATHLEVNARDTKIVARAGRIKITGTGDTQLGLAPGESATLSRAGDHITPLEAIPKDPDFRVPVGESFTVHDPRPPTAIQFQFLGQCKDGGTIELDHDARFHTAKVSTGADNANLAVAPGGWAYRLRCTQGGVPGATVASGHLVVMRDDGRRPLPPREPPNPVDADGRTWRIKYQALIPDLQVHYIGPAGGALKLHLAAGGKDQTFDGGTASPTSVVVVPGSQLREGTYTYWFDQGGTRQDKVSTLKIEFDQAAPQVYIEAPPNAQLFAAQIDVRGAVLPGWSAAVAGVDLPLDKQRRFVTSVKAPDTAALAIRLSHPQRGVHYYLRRTK